MNQILQIHSNTKKDDLVSTPNALWVSGARQYTKKSYTDLTPDLRQI